MVAACSACADLTDLSSFNHTNDNHVQMEVSNEIRSFSSKSHSIGRGNDGPSSPTGCFLRRTSMLKIGELMTLACRVTMTSVLNAALSPNVSTIVRWGVRRFLLHSCQMYIHCRMTADRHPAWSTTLRCVPCDPSLRLVKCLTRMVPCPTRRSSLDMASHCPRTNMTPSEWCWTRYQQ